MSVDVRVVGGRVTAAALVGALTGVVVIGVEYLVKTILHQVGDASPAIIAAALVIGAVAGVLLASFLGGRSSSTTETYVVKFHDDDAPLEPLDAPGRLAASVASLGSGAPLGMEGPAVYSGAVIATLLQRWSWARAVPANGLLVAGAAAGVAAVFKAPVAGAIFALEVPFRHRLAGERLLPALFGSATGYLTLTALEGTEPELNVAAVELTFGRAMASLLLGAIVGLVARGIIALIRIAEGFGRRHHRRAHRAGGSDRSQPARDHGGVAHGRRPVGEPCAAAVSGRRVTAPGIRPPQHSSHATDAER